MLAVAAVAVAAGAATATRGAGPDPAASYPADPRTATGADPSKLLPEAKECSPTRDRPGVADYTRLATLKQSQGRNPVAVGAPATTIVTLTNKKGQQFRLYISGGSKDAVAAYVAAVSACVETFALPSAAPILLVPVPVFRHLVDVAVAKSQRTAAALSARRDVLAAASGRAALFDVLTALGVDPQTVAAAAVQATDADLVLRAAELTAAGVAPPDVPVLVDDLMLQPLAPFLSNPGDDPGTAAERGKLLFRKPLDIVVGIEPLATAAHPLPKRYVAWAAFDFAKKAAAKRRPASASAATTLEPPLGYLIKHQYLAKCQASASAQIKASIGKAGLKLWRMSGGTTNVQVWSDYAESSAASGTSRNLWNSWGSNRTYDTWVKGLDSTTKTTYSMYGGWTLSSVTAGCSGHPS
jgi:hypothetical protein